MAGRELSRALRPSAHFFIRAAASRRGACSASRVALRNSCTLCYLFMSEGEREGVGGCSRPRRWRPFTAARPVVERERGHLSSLAHFSGAGAALAADAGVTFGDDEKALAVMLGGSAVLITAVLSLVIGSDLFIKNGGSMFSK